MKICFKITVSAALFAIVSFALYCGSNNGVSSQGGQDEPRQEEPDTSENQRVWVCDGVVSLLPCSQINQCQVGEVKVGDVCAVDCSHPVNQQNPDCVVGPIEPPTCNDGQVLLNGECVSDIDCENPINLYNPSCPNYKEIPEAAERIVKIFNDCASSEMAQEHALFASQSLAQLSNIPLYEHLDFSIGGELHTSLIRQSLGKCVLFRVNDSLSSLTNVGEVHGFSFTASVEHNRETGDIERAVINQIHVGNPVCDLNNFETHNHNTGFVSVRGSKASYGGDAKYDVNQYDCPKSINLGLTSEMLRSRDIPYVICDEEGLEHIN